MVGRLCQRAIWLEEGRVRDDGHARDILEAYLRTTVPTAPRVDIPVPATRGIRDLSLSLLRNGAPAVDAPRRDEALTFELDFTTVETMRGLDIAVFLVGPHGVRVMSENLSDAGSTISGPPQRHRVDLTIPPLLAAGDWVVGVWFGTNDEVYLSSEALRLTVLPLPSDPQHTIQGLVRPPVRWTVDSGEPSVPEASV
jgi:ABC-2 type transport system ATP-binding protein/lipopolysaccharide transport system ATP-binding protein